MSSTYTTPTPTIDPVRATRLNKIFDTVCNGRTSVSASNGPLFLEAICAQPDAVACISKINLSSKGLAAVQAAMRFDLSPSFMNNSASPVLEFARNPDVKAIDNGSFLSRLITHVIEPPIFWSAYANALQSGALDERAQRAFAWLFLQVIMLPTDTLARQVIDEARLLEVLLDSLYPDVRATAEKIKHILSAADLGHVVGQDGPGGRHDNDFVDYRMITVIPTADEVESTETPFLRTVSFLDDISPDPIHANDYLDNHFRLLREDMLYELREERQVAMGQRKGRKHRGVVIDGLKFLDVYCGDDARRIRWGLKFQCPKDFWGLDKLKNVKARKDYLTQHRRLLKDRSLTLLLADGRLFALATIHRNEDLLASKPPIVVLQVQGDATTASAFLNLKTANSIKLIQIDTALFAYEPILKSLQCMRNVPLAPELLYWKTGDIPRPPDISSAMDPLLRALQANPSIDIRPYLRTAKTITLDQAQAMSFCSGLTQKVSLIQGPPGTLSLCSTVYVIDWIQGTGKSFIGALVAKAIHDFTSSTILVVCFTNHALDQFLEDLLDIGIPQENMLRIGSKSSARTEPMNLHHKRPGKVSNFKHICSLKDEAEVLARSMKSQHDRYQSSVVKYEDILIHLEFDFPEFYEAFYVPGAENGMVQVGRGNRKVDKYNLLQRWLRNENPGFFSQSENVVKAAQIWQMSPNARRDIRSRWESEILKDQVDGLREICSRYNDCLAKIDREYANRAIAVMQGSRIIACTTTGAAMHSESLRAVAPDVLLVEEAGEILESHTITALGEEAKQMILIGDHQQLRPKANNYHLSVEKAEGFDLNRSLFERLVLKGYPHHVLRKQHRMRPEISHLIRQLTYKDLVDAPSTLNHPDLKGVSDNVIFINHNHLEDENVLIGDNLDMGSKSSKQNTYEADMVLKIVRYLRQQGYATNRMVVLTPYLGQLHKLQDILKNDADTILNDLDSNELVRAGLLTPQT